MKEKIHNVILEKSQLKPILFVILCTLFNSAGQIFWKISASNVDTLSGIITNVPLFLGFACYGISSVLLILALKYGDLSSIYPFLALSFVWVSISSIIIMGETISTFNWIGICSIILGVSFIGYGSAK